MRVLELWRYPVKSLQGERLDACNVGSEGLFGDRGWALFDTATGFGLTARRVPELLFASARLVDDDPTARPEVVLPDGTVTTEDDVLSEWIGRPVELRPASFAGARHYENPDEGEQRWNPFSGAGGAFHDSSRARVTLLSTGSTGDWAPRRFRANVLLDGAGEDDLVGARVRLGTVALQVGMHVIRCVMITRPQPGGIEKDIGVLRAIHRQHDGALAVGALPVRGGRIAVGDELATNSGGDTRSMQTVELRPGEDTIRLGQLLKLIDVVPTGAQVKDVLADEVVTVNGEPEDRRGRQLHRGDVVAIEGLGQFRVG